MEWNGVLPEGATWCPPSETPATTSSRARRRVKRVSHAPLRLGTRPRATIQVHSKFIPFHSIPFHSFMILCIPLHFCCTRYKTSGDGGTAMKTLGACLSLPPSTPLTHSASLRAVTVLAVVRSSFRNTRRGYSHARGEDLTRSPLDGTRAHRAKPPCAPPPLRAAAPMRRRPCARETTARIYRVSSPSRRVPQEPGREAGRREVPHDQRREPKVQAARLAADRRRRGAQGEAS